MNKIDIFSDTELDFPRWNLEDDIDSVLNGGGEVIAGGQGTRGWDIQVGFIQDMDYAVITILKVLKDSKVPTDTRVGYDDKEFLVYDEHTTLTA